MSSRVFLFRRPGGGGVSSCGFDLQKVLRGKRMSVSNTATNHTALLVSKHRQPWSPPSPPYLNIFRRNFHHSPQSHFKPSNMTIAELKTEEEYVATGKASASKHESSRLIQPNVQVISK